MGENNYEKATNKLQNKAIPKHPQWNKEEDFGSNGAVVYWYSNWEVGPGDYGGEPQKYEHVSEEMHGFSLELRYDGDDNWSAVFLSPTPWGSYHEPDNTKSVSEVDLNSAIEHIKFLLTSLPNN